MTADAIITTAEIPYIMSSTDLAPIARPPKKNRRRQSKKLQLSDSDTEHCNSDNEYSNATPKYLVDEKNNHEKGLETPKRDTDNNMAPPPARGSSRSSKRRRKKPEEQFSKTNNGKENKIW